jgi:site-specific recombinase XerD
LLGVWVRRFLLEHVVAERNLSRNTQRSYRDTFAILLPFVSTRKRKPIDRLCVADFSSDTLKHFLDHLEREVLDPFPQPATGRYPRTGPFRCRT